MNWIVVENMRRPPFWVFVAVLVTLTAVVERWFMPGQALVTVGTGCVVVAVGYGIVARVAAWQLTRSRSRLLLVAFDGTAVIAFRQVVDPGGRACLVVAHHVARRVGCGDGRRLRAALAPSLVEHLVRHPQVWLKFTAVTGGMLDAYLADLRQWAPVDDGWDHAVEGLKVTIRRCI